MTTRTAPTTKSTAHQRRLRTTVQRLVIELGYLEHCCAQELQDAQLQTAAAGLDSAIAALNHYLTGETTRRAA